MARTFAGFASAGALLLVLLATSRGLAQERQAPPSAEDPTSSPGPSLYDGLEFSAFEGFDLVRLTQAKFFETLVEVATAGTGATKLREAPSVVEVVTAEDIAMWGYRSVDEALRHIVGFYSTDDHTIANLGVRGVSGGLGAEGSIVKVMLDGHPMNFRPTSGAHLGVELIPMSAVERIEIIRGPASAVYGADAFLAVVNVVTRAQVADGYSGNVRLRGGYSGLTPSGSGDFRFGAKSGAWSLLAAGTLDRSDRSGLVLPSSSPAPIIPEYASDTTTQGLSRSDHSTYIKLAYENAEGTVRSAHVGFRGSALEREGDFARWGQLTTDGAEDRGTVIALGQDNLLAGAQFQFARDITATARLQHAWGGSGDQERIEVGSDLFYVQRNWGFRSTDGAVAASWRSDAPFGITVGSEFVTDSEDIENTSRVSLPQQEREPSMPVPKRALNNIGLLLQSHYYALEKRALKCTGGLRFDQHSIYGSQLTGRMAAVMVWNEKLVTKALYGSAFKAPAPFLLFSKPLLPGDVVGNPELAPQLVHSFETHAIYRLHKYLNVSIGGTYSLVHDKAEFIAEGINQTAQNIATANILTGEAKLEVRWNEKLRGYIAAEYNRHERDVGQPGYRASLVGSRNGVYPSVVARAGASTSRSLANGLRGRFGLQGRYVGRRTSSDANSLENLAPYSLPAFIDIDARASVHWSGLGDRANELSLRVINAADTSAPDPGFAGVDFPQAPRQVYLEWSSDI